MRPAAIIASLAGPGSQSLINAKLYLLLRFIKLTGFLLRLNFTDDPLEQFHGFSAALAFVTLDVHLDAAVGPNGNVEFALWHKNEELAV